MGANEGRHVLSMAADLGKVIGLELMTAAQALELRIDMIRTACAFAAKSTAEAFAQKISGKPLPTDEEWPAFLAEVEALRQELAGCGAIQASPAVMAAKRVMQDEIAYLERDRALDADVRKATDPKLMQTVLDTVKATVRGR